MRITLAYLIFFSALFVFNSCDRAHENSSKVSLTMPTAKPQSFSLNSTVSVNSVTALNDWAPIIPTGFAGDQPVNCYFVAVSGPDPILRSRACYKTVNSTTSSTNQPLFAYGFIAGPIPEGQTINLEVPSGPDRVFKILAAHATSLAECRPEFGKENLSKPYVLGEVGRINLEPNVDATVTVPVSFDQNQYVDGCDLVAPPPAPAAPPTHINVEFENPLFGENVYDNQCVPTMVSITDTSGIITFMNSADLTLGFRTDNSSDQSSYLDFYRCANSISADSTFVFPKNVFKAKRWLRVDSSWASATSLGLHLHPPALTLRGAPSKRFAVSTQFVYLANVPNFIRNDTCYPIFFSKRSVDSSLDATLNSDDVTISAQNATAGSIISFHTSNTCSGAGTTNFTSGPYPNIKYDKIYFKTSGVPIGDAVNFTVANTSVSSDNTHFKSILKGGLDSFNRFKVKGPIEIKRLTSAICHGPFKLYLTNEIDTETQNKQTTNRNFRFLYNDATVQFYQTPDCSTGIINSSNTAGTIHLSVPPNETSKEFYLKVSAVAISGDRTVTVIDDEKGLNHLFKIFIEVP